MRYFLFMACLAMVICGPVLVGPSGDGLAQSAPGAPGAPGAQGIQGNQDDQTVGIPRACRRCMRTCTGACTVPPGCVCIFERLPPDSSAPQPDNQSCGPLGVYSSEFNACVLDPDTVTGPEN